MSEADITYESTSRTAEVGGLKVHYNDAGEGPAVIMLHGGGAGASAWVNFSQNMAAFARRHRVLAIDQIGFGKTPAVTIDEPAPARNARMFRDLLDHLGIEKASLVGNSMGGANAMTFALDYPERTDKLVLMGPAIGVSESNWVPSPSEGGKALRAAAQNPSIETLRNLFSLMVYDQSIVTDELLESRLEAALATHGATVNAPGGLLGGRNLLREVGNCQAKTLLVWGRDERFAPLDMAIRMVWAMPDAQVHIFSKCGHWAQFEKASEFNSLVMNFLAP